jgi:hypothetical protein
MHCKFFAGKENNMPNKTGPRAKPKSEHFRILTVTLPPEIYEALMEYKGENKLSPTVARLILLGLNSEKAYDILNDAYGNANAQYKPAALRAMGILKGE